MKVAVISDIHANNIGLNLAIEDALENGVEQFIFLGDYITDGDQNNEVLDTVKQYATYTIRGNRERYMCNFDPQKKEFANYRTIAHTHDNLSKVNLEYIKSLKDSEIIQVNGYKISLTHGDLYGQTRDGLESIFKRMIEESDFDICLFGHFHRYYNRTYCNRYFISPGSIGGPTDTPTYKYVILNLTDKVNVELREFDVEDTYQALETQYKKSDYYKENFEWCDLVLRGIKDGQDYCTPFMSLLNKKLKGIQTENCDEFNQCWKETYCNFIDNFNEMDYKKFDDMLKQNNLGDIDAFFNFCKTNIAYGWIDKKGMKHYENNHMDKYFLQSPVELLKSKMSVCWDRTELYRTFFSRMVIEFETYILYYYMDDHSCHSHSILIYYENDKVSWFEPMLKHDVYNDCKIHEYHSLEELLVDFKKGFTLNGIANGFLPESCKDENYFCYQYTEPKYHITVNEFYDHCRKGENIIL